MLTGVISPADMEANYQGFIFYRRMCNGDEPLMTGTGPWHFSAGFDFRDYVSPEWDESWNPNIYSPHRWKNIRKTMRGYCPLLDSTWVMEQRAHYAELDRQTPLENLLMEMVAADELADPRQFDITSVCSDQN